MSTKFKNLKNDLQDLEQEVDDSVMGTSTNASSGNSKVANYILLFAFIATLLFYTGDRIGSFFQDLNPLAIEQLSEEITDAVQSFNEYDPELLQGMRDWMEDLGYGVLTDEELSALRDEGVTATQTQALHDIGYTDITLEQLVELQRGDVTANYISGIRDAGYTEAATFEDFIDLQRADVSARYASMMKGLGYDLSIDQLAQTRRSGVTAFFTSNMMDLGYTLEELTVENLIRMRSIGVDHETAAALMDERGERLTVDELIRYEISNQ